MGQLLGGLITGSIDALNGLATPTVEYLVVAGGGGGAAQNNSGGGGGAGGLLTAAGFPVVQGTTYQVTVGSGGAVAAAGYKGYPGSNSSFGSVTTMGGGGGGFYADAANSSNGGSGGGAAAQSGQPAGTGTTGQGGIDNYTGGDGGTGFCSTITGEPIFFAGGGGGGVGGGGNAPGHIGGRGSAGGGGKGSDYTPGETKHVLGQAFPNTLGASTAALGGNPYGGVNGLGGGGGGGGQQGNRGSTGGSGIVIVRYSDKCLPPASTTGTPQILYNNGYQIYVWTASGSITF